jgi:hypothetical protein
LDPDGVAGGRLLARDPQPKASAATMTRTEARLSNNPDATHSRARLRRLNADPTDFRVMTGLCRPAPSPDLLPLPARAGTSNHGRPDFAARRVWHLLS